MFFSISQIADIKNFYNKNGYVTIHDLLDKADVKRLRDAFDEAVSKGNILLDREEFITCNDVIYRHHVFEEYAKDSRLVNLAETLFERKGLELQHSKLNAKPIADQGTGKIQWHQDYPFFPHTNYDLAAFGIHFDDEDIDSGPLLYIAGSHKLGVLSHCKDDKFAYECTEKKVLEQSNPEVVCCKAGYVTFHHCLTLHSSERKKNNKPRRLLVFQLRTLDNIQIAGVLWKCTGFLINDGIGKGKARFVDGSSVEIRGKSGRLFDKYAKLAPDQAS
jgi:phytanoyl-CoA hydroxylase